MIELQELFVFHNARSKAFEDHTSGDIAFVTNGLKNNGVIGFVNPLKGDRQFEFKAITVSAFCEATVQILPFIGRGNGGSGLTVLEPRTKMNNEELFFYAAAISKQLSWRFSYGRMANVPRLSSLKISEHQKTRANCNLRDRIPVSEAGSTTSEPLHFKDFVIESLFHLERGDFHSMKILKEGNYPTVSRSTEDNGIVAYSSIPKGAVIHKPPLITVSTTSGDAFVQVDDFLATDNVVILVPKFTMKPISLYFVTLMINREKWRYSYGRQCYKEKFAKTRISLPVNSKGELNEDVIDRIVSNKPYWNVIAPRLPKNLTTFSEPTNKELTLAKFISGS